MENTTTKNRQVCGYCARPASHLFANPPGPDIPVCDSPQCVDNVIWGPLPGKAHR